MSSSDAKKNILYVVPSAGIGGAETFIKHVAKFSQEYRPIFCLFRDGELRQWLEKERATFYIATPQPRIRHPLRVLKTILWLSQIAKKHQCPLIHSTMSYGALFGSLAAKKAGIKHLWYQHGPATGWDDKLIGRLPSEMMLTNSQYTLNEQIQLEGRPLWTRKERKYRILSLGVEDADSHKKPPRDEKKLIATMLCRPQNWKGIHLFIQALKESQSQIKDVSILGRFIGGAPNASHANNYEKSLRSLANDLQAPIEFVGPTDKPLKALLNSDILVNASTIPEPFGLSIIEAMSVGVVPIAPCYGGPLEIIEDGVDGIFFEPNDYYDLSEKLTFLAKHPEHLQTLGENSRHKIKKKYNAQKTIQNLESIYGELLK